MKVEMSKRMSRSPFSVENSERVDEETALVPAKGSTYADNLELNVANFSGSK